MSGYSEGGASRAKKTLQNWLPEHYSAKRDIDWNIDLLRRRSADLVMNSPVAAAAINTLTTNVIGSGLKVFPRIRRTELGMTAQAARQLAEKIKREFEIWCRVCDWQRKNNFYELQRIAFSSYLVEGDSFCLFKRRGGEPYSLKIQLIEAGRVSSPGNGAVETVRGQNRVVNGIEVDKDGVLEAIWVSNRQYNEPDMTSTEMTWQRVKCFGARTGLRNVLQISNETRPGMFRGVPVLAPVLEPLKQTARYGEAELTTAIIRSFFSIFFTQPAANFNLNEITDSDDEIDFKAGSPSIMSLPKGVDVKAIDAAQMQSQFGNFLTAYIKMVGAALNIPYEVLMKNFQSSYSASRAALLEAQNAFRQYKASFVQDFCAPIYEMFLMEAAARGRINAPKFFEKREAYLSAEWYNENNHFIDPVKEMTAVQMRLASGLTTYEKETAELTGLDYWDNLESLRQAREAGMDERADSDSGRDINGDIS